MSQRCPHCKARLPASAKRVCPKCLASLADASEPKEVGKTDSPLDKAQLVGIWIEGLFYLPILLLIPAGIVYVFGFSPKREDVIFTIVSALAALGCGWFLYRVVRNYVAWMRVPRDG